MKRKKMENSQNNLSTGFFFEVKLCVLKNNLKPTVQRTLDPVRATVSDSVLPP